MFLKQGTQILSTWQVILAAGEVEMLKRLLYFSSLKHAQWKHDVSNFDNYHTVPRNAFYIHYINTDISRPGEKP